MELARRGPAFPALVAAGAVDEARWAEAAAFLEQALPDAPGKALRIHWLTVPVYLWLRAQLARAPSRPLLAGLSAPQGAGKSTLCRLLVQLFAQEQRRVVALSIDDFYLRREEQLALAARHPGNPYLLHRGYPGTHDVALGTRTLLALREGRAVALPRYDKSAHGGRGDRSPHGELVEGPVDLVLLEGWMLGFVPTPTEDPALQLINQLLQAYQAWHRLLDAWIILRAEDPRSVLQWRAQAEAEARAAGRPALSPPEVEDYVRRFLPAYALYGPTVGQTAVSQPLRVTLDAARRPRT